MIKINSIGYGATIVKLILLFLVGIPVPLYLLSGVLGNGIALISSLLRISLGIGVLIVIFLIVLLGIELNQDKRINRRYLNNRDRRTRLSNGRFECENCGNLHVQEHETSCPVCGITFRA